MVARRRLDNAAWGFASSCFVCDQANARGLALPFWYDDETRRVTAELRLGEAYSGVPRYLHGGVVLAVLDEAMAWAAIAAAERFAVVARTATRFERPALVDHPYIVTAEVDSATTRLVEARAEVRESDGRRRRCAEARARLVVMTEATAANAIGEVGEEAARYLRR